MRSTSRRTFAAVTALAALVVALVASGSAGADPAAAPPAGTYHGSAAAAALDLQVLGNGLTLASSLATVAHDPSAPATNADAVGDGLLLGGNPTGEQKASASADGTSDGGDLASPSCTGALPSGLPVGLDLVCSAAHASIAGGNPSSGANANVAGLTVDASQFSQPLSQVTDNVQNLVDQLSPVFSGVNDATNLDLQSALSQLLDAIAQGNLVDVDLGPTAVSSSFDGSKVVSTADAKGAVIQLLPGAPALTPASADDSSSPSTAAAVTGPIATITVSEATNTVTVDASTGTPTVAFDPALVTITLRPDIAEALGNPPNPITVKPGQSKCLGLPAPLDSCITVAGGSQKTLDDGTTEADAAGVSIDLLTGLPGNGIHLGLAQTAVQGLYVVAAPTVETPTTATPAPAADEPLARTGGSTPMALVGGLLGVAALGWVATRRRRLGVG